MPPIFLIANCTASKKTRGAEVLRCGEFPGPLIQKLSNWWRECLVAQPKIPAKDLYQGDSWLQALQAFKWLQSRAPEVEFLVVSAGLGFFSAMEAIPVYSATFAFGDPDSVGSCITDNQKWWEKLSSKREELDGLGSIANLASMYPDAVFLISLSATYLKAILPDLIKARESLSDPRRMIIVSTGSTKIAALGTSLLPLDARFENKLGGTRNTLNNRLLYHIAKRFTPGNLRVDKISLELGKELAELEPIRTFSRTRMTDDDIIKKIKKEIIDNPNARPSTLLRKFRDGGMACEKNRFNRLFAQLIN